MIELGKVFRIIRKSKGYTQKNVTKDFISQGAYSKFESNKTEINANSYIHLLNNLHMASEEFIFIANDYQFTEYDKIIYRFFNLPYNDVTQLKMLQNEIMCLQDTEDVLVKDIQIICKALISLAQTNCVATSQKMVEPIWERLSKHDNWYLTDIRLINVILYLFPVETAIEITKRVLKRLDLYQGFSDAGRLKIAFYMNLSLLLIKNEDYEKALKFLDLTISNLHKSMNYVTLALCFARKSICLYHLGIETEVNYLEKAKQISFIYEDNRYWTYIEQEFYRYCPI